MTTFLKLMVLRNSMGCFRKGKVPSHVSRVTRLIMKMIPSNSYQRMLTDSLGTLHSSTSWTQITLQDGQVLLWSSDDQRGAFYVFRLPQAWRKYMAFRKPVPGHLFHSSLPWLYVSAAVIPMGWLSAVSLFQHLTRQLSYLPKPMGAQLDPRSEWRRDAKLPWTGSERDQA